VTTANPSVRQQPVLTLDSALTLVRHALTEAAALDLAVSVAIVDPSMDARVAEATAARTTEL
jgi:uncharacterized protein GlcG (DUF336 family)